MGLFYSRSREEKLLAGGPWNNRRGSDVARRARNLSRALGCFAKDQLTCDPRRIAGEDARATSLNFQHPIQRHTCPVLHIIANFDLIHDVPVNQILESPAQMLR